MINKKELQKGILIEEEIYNKERERNATEVERDS